MKIGMSIGYAGAKMDIPIKRIQRAEELGFNAVWVAETYSSDAITPLAWIGAQTKRIRLGTGIAALAARTPTNLAMCAQTIDAMCGEGRMVVGLGVSGPQIVEGWYGQPWGKPADRIRDYVAIMRQVWKREGPVAHQGKEISLPYTGPGSSGLGKPLKSILHGNPAIPVMLGTSTPLSIRMTGEIADGWLSMHIPPRMLAPKLALLEEGIARRSDGKTLKDMELVANVTLHLTDDVRAAIDAAKPNIALYVGGMGAKEKNFHNDAMVERGFAEAAGQIQELYLAGRKDEAAAAVPDEYIDESALIGPPARLAERFAPWRDSAFTLLRLNCHSTEAIEAIARIARA